MKVIKYKIITGLILISLFVGGCINKEDMTAVDNGAVGKTTIALITAKTNSKTAKNSQINNTSRISKVDIKRTETDNNKLSVSNNTNITTKTQTTTTINVPKKTTKAIAVIRTVKVEVIGPNEVGQILDRNIELKEEENTVLELLLALEDNGDILIDYSGGKTATYIKGVNGVYEKDFGPLSGWMYSVNGEFPLKSAGKYPVVNGDIIKVLYTKDLGKDIK